MMDARLADREEGEGGRGGDSAGAGGGGEGGSEARLIKRRKKRVSLTDMRPDNMGRRLKPLMKEMEQLCKDNKETNAELVHIMIVVVQLRLRGEAPKARRILLLYFDVYCGAEPMELQEAMILRASMLLSRRRYMTLRKMIRTFCGAGKENLFPSYAKLHKFELSTMPDTAERSQEELRLLHLEMESRCPFETVRLFSLVFDLVCGTTSSSHSCYCFLLSPTGKPCFSVRRARRAVFHRHEGR